eukprot:6490268-Amphidinium_carterae.1
MRKQGVLSEWEASGADKVGEVEVEMCAVLSLVSYLPESLLADLLADNRLLMQVGRLQAAMHALFSWLEHLSSSFWSLLAAFVSLPPSLLRDKVIRGSLVSMSYVQVKIFDVVADHPWSLAVGVIAENVQALSELEECPSNGVARKMWALLRAGMSQADMVQVLSVMSTCSFTSHFSKKQHSSAALFKKRHDYNTATLIARSFIHTFRQLLPATTDEEKELEKLRTSLISLRKIQMSHLTGRQCFLGEMMKARMNKSVPLKLHKLTPQAIMVQHGAIWASMSAERKHTFECMAKAMRDHRGGELQEYIAEQTHAFSQVETSIAQSKHMEGAMKMSSARLNPADLKGLQNLISSDMWTKKQLQANRERSSSCPEPLSVHSFGEYVSRSSLELPEHPHLSPLGRRIAGARDVLQGVALGVPDGDCVSWYKFTHAVLAPGRLFLLPLEVVSLPLQTCGPSLHDWNESQRSVVHMAWHYTAGVVDTTDVFAHVEPEAVLVQTCCFMKGPGL